MMVLILYGREDFVISGLDDCDIHGDFTDRDARGVRVVRDGLDDRHICQVHDGLLVILGSRWRGGNELFQLTELANDARILV
jgi:hypothetical protein